MLLILDIEHTISKDHIARVVDEMVESCPLSSKNVIESSFICLYKKTYASRAIEAMLEENVLMMWLTAMKKPDHHTNNDF